MNTFSSILLIGCGKMGGALLFSWVSHGVAPESMLVVEQTEEAADLASHIVGVKVVRQLSDVPTLYQPEVIVLAVKPQNLDSMLPELAKRFGHQPLYISIAAGKPIAYFRAHLGFDAPVIRSMPNTPALANMGMTVLCANDQVSPLQLSGAQALFKAVGEVETLDDESLMDAVTALSGSGPAYLFLFAEAMTEAGLALGLDEGMAKRLTLNTLRGSAELARNSSQSLEQLRKNVTSPGGTTEAAMTILMRQPALKELIREAMEKAAARSRELAS